MFKYGVALTPPLLAADCGVYIAVWAFALAPPILAGACGPCGWVQVFGVPASILAGVGGVGSWTGSVLPLCFLAVDCGLCVWVRISVLTLPNLYGPRGRCVWIKEIEQAALALSAGSGQQLSVLDSPCALTSHMSSKHRSGQGCVYACTSGCM